jgi:Transglycosylase associated protein
VPEAGELSRQVQTLPCCCCRKKIFHVHSLQGFFNLSTWLTAIVGAAILLLAYHLVTSQTSRSGRSRRFARR